MNYGQDSRTLEESMISSDDCDILRLKSKDKNWEQGFRISDYDYKILDCDCDS